MQTRHGYVSMPGHFLPDWNGEDQFLKFNSTLELINEVKVMHRDDLPEWVKRQTDIRHFPIKTPVEEPERVVEEIIEAVQMQNEHLEQKALELSRKEKELDEREKELDELKQYLLGTASRGRDGSEISEDENEQMLKIVTDVGQKANQDRNSP